MQKNLALIIVLLVIICSCGNRNTSDAVSSRPSVKNESSTEDSDIVLRMLVNDWEISHYRDIVDAFESDNPGIKIKLISLEETLGTESLETLSTNDVIEQLVSSADVLSARHVGDTISSPSPFLLNLQPFLETDSSFDKDDFCPNTLEYFDSGDGVWGLPSEISFLILFYNKKVFDELRVDYPHMGWSWDDLLEIAKRTTVRNGEQVVQWGLVHPGRNPIEFIIPRSGSVIDNLTDPPLVRINSPDVAYAMQWYEDLYYIHGVAPVSNELSSDYSFASESDIELIERGNASIWAERIEWWFWRKEKPDIGVVPFPIDSSSDHTNRIFVDGYVISSGTKHPEIAWRLINFLSLQSPKTTIPARRSVAEAYGVWDDINPDLKDVLLYALDHSYFIQPSSGYNAFESVTQSILKQEQSIEVGLANAQIRIEEELSNYFSEELNRADIEVDAPLLDEYHSHEEDTKIVFYTGHTPGGSQAYYDLAKAFQLQYPDVIVEFSSTDIDNPFTINGVANASDCFLWFGGVSSEVEQAAILSLEPFIAEDTNFDKSDFYPQVLNYFMVRGELFGLPAEVNIPLIIYNKSLFDTLSVAYPQYDWTVDDFLTIAMTFTDEKDFGTKRYGYVSQEFETNDLTIFLERLGAQILNDSVDPPRLTFTHPDTLDAMRWYTSLTTEFGVKPRFITSIAGSSLGSAEKRKSLIENGYAAMWSEQGFPSEPAIVLDNLDIL